MPEVRFTVHWPDASVSECYSPSTVIHQHLRAGERYLLDDFLQRASTALQLASERVRLRYGYACSSALDQLRRIETDAARFRKDGATVLVAAMRPQPDSQ